MLSFMKSARNTHGFDNSKLHIRNMVSIRCKMVVKAALDELGLQYGEIELGEVQVFEHITNKRHDALNAILLKSGLELLEDKKAVLVDKIKDIIIEMIHYEDKLPDVKYSEYISEKLKQDFTYLNNLFSEVKGISIKHYIVYHKIEKAKEWLMYDQFSLKEISFKLQYSSEAHLCNQFKKTTGLPPSFFKAMKLKKTGRSG